MQPSHQPNLNLPPIITETGPQAFNKEAPPAQHPETYLDVESTPEPQIMGVSQPPLPLIPVDNTPIQSPPVVDDQTIAPISPVIADDSRDLIEKEWIIRAKSIVNRTREDPRQQSREFNKLKAEYIKHRYNMTIKITDE